MRGNVLSTEAVRGQLGQPDWKRDNNGLGSTPRTELIRSLPEYLRGASVSDKVSGVAEPWIWNEVQWMRSLGRQIKDQSHLKVFPFRAQLVLNEASLASTIGFIGNQLQYTSTSIGLFLTTKSKMKNLHVCLHSSRSGFCWRSLGDDEISRVHDHL